MRDLIKKSFYKIFFFLDRFGIHILPKHYYSPLPDFLWLSNNKNLWVNRNSLAGVNWNLDNQLEWLKKICEPYYGEVAGLKLYKDISSAHVGPGYGPIESQVLYCVIRSLVPAKIIEIGSGVSTYTILSAIKENVKNNKNKTEVTCIEPYPRQSLIQNNEILLRKELCQETQLSVFDSLNSGDVLFIDSSHAVKTGSDVVKIYLEIIPRLKPGIFIHIHDIYLPYLYSRHVLNDFFGWQETALLLALLINNRKLSIASCLSGLHYDKTEEMKKILTDYRPQDNEFGLLKAPEGDRHFPASIWLTTK
jgi:hypothetical protein